MTRQLDDIMPIELIIANRELTEQNNKAAARIAELEAELRGYRNLNACINTLEEIRTRLLDELVLIDSALGIVEVLELKSRRCWIEYYLGRRDRP